MTEAEPIRIQKLLADAGICSRRSAELLIASQQVWVNGAPAVPGQKVSPGNDKITVNGKPVHYVVSQGKITLALNKPRGFVCSNNDPHNPKTIFDLLPRELAQNRFFCAGRLDKDSEGLVIVTTDGSLANRLMHPRNVIVKRYHVSLKKPFPKKHLSKLIRGVRFEDELFKVEHAALVNPTANDSAVDLDVHMHHGKKREIRLLFSMLGYDVRRLKRYQIGSFPLRGIPRGAMKRLNGREIKMLFNIPSDHKSTPLKKLAGKRMRKTPASH